MNLLPEQVHDGSLHGKWYRSFLIFLLLSFLWQDGRSQEKVVTAGFQFKPIFSSDFFNTGPVDASFENVSIKITPGSGYCMGMVIRAGLTNTVSLETGINFVKRNYDFKLDDPDSMVFTSADFSIIGYEVPLLGMVFIRLSDKIYMNTALGFSFDFYPSDIGIVGTEYLLTSYRDSWFSPSLLANLGWEYRTEKAGYIYLGASYHRPFKSIHTIFVRYLERDPYLDSGPLELNGNYLTFDIRYFFHSDPAKRKKKVRKPDPRTK